MGLAVYTREGKETGRSCSWPKAWDASKVNPHVLYLDVKRYRSSLRSHTHSTKMRAEVEASTRKIKRQKGSGTARAGALTSPIFRGGGATFGPRPGGKQVRLNQKTRQLACRTALGLKHQEKALTLIEEFQFEKPSTRAYIQFLNQFALAEKRSLLVVGTRDEALYLSSRNLKRARVVRVQELNTYDVLESEHVLLSEKALESLTKRWS